MWTFDGRPWLRKTRHMCGNLCFFKAYAPARKWYKLVACVEERGLDAADMLEGWSARLVEEVCVADSDEDEDDNDDRGGGGGESKRKERICDNTATTPSPSTSTSTSTSKSPSLGGFSVYFYAPNGDTFRTVRAVCEALAMEDGSERRGGGMRRFPRAVIEAEIKKSTSWADIDPRNGSNKRVKMLPSSPPSAKIAMARADALPSAASLAKTLWPGKTFIFSPSRESPFGLLEEVSARSEATKHCLHPNRFLAANTVCS